MRPAALVAAVTAGLWLWWDVPLGHVLRFLGYTAFVIALGWQLWRRLAGDRAGGALQQLVMGWALGLVVVIAVYLPMSAVGLRSVWWIAPLIAGVAAGVRGPRPEVVRASAPDWALAAVCVCALALLATGLFTQHPLSGHYDTVAYHPDTVFTIALSAEAEHRWPIRNPSVAGTPLPYHVFAHVENAAAAHLTGLPLDELVMRLTPAALFVLLTLAMAAAARACFPEHRWAPVIAPALLLLVGEFDPWSGERYTYPFANVFFLDLFLSPTFLLGACLFLPALIVLREALAAGRERTGLWVALGLLLFGCAGAKATTLPVLGVGIGTVVLWGLWRDRVVARRAFAAGLLLVGVFAAFYVLLYTGRSAGFEYGRWRSLQQASWISDLYDDVSPRAFQPLSLALGLLGLAGPAMIAVLGLLWKRRLDAPIALLAGTTAVGAGALLLLDSVDGSHLYFVWFGYITGVLLAAGGLAALWEARARAGAKVVLAFAALLAVGGLLDQPLDLGAPLRARANAGNPPYLVDYEANRGVTAGTMAGLRYVRDHTDPEDVVATNIHTKDAEFDSRYFYVSAFTERRVFIESWLYTSRTAELGYRAVASGEKQPFEDRLALNQAVFVNGDRAALDELHRRGVRMLVAYKRYGLGADAVRRIAPVAFENDDIAVLSATPR
jgi:hypothetical protein